MVPKGERMSRDSAATKRFRVALSFPGEYDDRVRAIAERLAVRFGQNRVLYDKFYDAEFARPDLDVYLPDLYRTQSDLIVVFLCPEYAKKRWCRLELRAVRQLIGSTDSSRIMYLGSAWRSSSGIAGGNRCRRLPKWPRRRLPIFALRASPSK